MPVLRYGGMKFVVIGLGKSGLSACTQLLDLGATVVACDENASATAPFASPRFSLKAGPLSPDFFVGADVVVVSPGVPWSKPELVTARNAGVDVIGEIELGARLLDQRAGPILSITGTNGKSTTTALLGELMKAAGKNTFVGGNLGLPFTEAWSHTYDTYVVELSSFQLEGMSQTEIYGAAILNLTPDHIDRYASEVEYGKAKARIFQKQPKNGFAVVNADDAAVVALSKAATVPVYGFTLNSQVKDTFAGLAIGTGDTFTFNFGNRDSYVVRNRALRGSHNLQNAMAASMMASLSGVSREAIQQGLDSFPGLAHRLEFVRDVNGVEFINDSKATNVDSSLMALKALKGNIWLIAGGKGKGAPYAPLVEAAAGKVKGVLTIGADAPALREAFSKNFAIHECQILENAVELARKLAVPGDIVLLSPACASYDQFKNFEHRGDRFKLLVRSL